MSDESTVAEASAAEELQNMSGAFAASLLRNNKKIRDDRALAIVEEAQMKFKRTVEDLQMRLKQLKRERDNMLDLSPTTADSLTLASDFDGSEFVANDLKIGLAIREVEIKLEVAESRYKQLFG